MGRSKNPRRNFTGNEAITRDLPNVPVSRPIGGIGGGPGVPPTFPRRPIGRRRRPPKDDRPRILPIPPDFV